MANLNPVEILALIIIIISLVKIACVLISPGTWLNFARKIYIKPQVTSTVAFFLASIVLYILIISGIKITEILAVTLFLMLIITVGIAKYGEDVLRWAMNQDMRRLLKDQWLYTLIWTGLLLWGIITILLS